MKTTAIWGSGSSGNAQWAKLSLTVGGWLLLNASTALGLYALASAAPINDTSIGHLMLIVRVVAIALVDLGCSFVLMWRGKSIQKHIEAIHKKAAAISSLADAERSITEADKNAALREKMMQSTFKDDEAKGKNEGRYGSR